MFNAPFDTFQRSDNKARRGRGMQPNKKLEDEFYMFGLELWNHSIQILDYLHIQPYKSHMCCFEFLYRSILLWVFGNHPIITVTIKADRLKGSF